MSAEVGLTEAEVVLGQTGEHVEPQVCRECGKSATACGRSRNFCCGACSQTRFRTHDPDPEPPAPDEVADAIAKERAAWVAKIEALADEGRSGFWEQDNHGGSSPDRVYGGWISTDRLAALPSSDATAALDTVREQAWDAGVRHAAAHIGVSPNGSLLDANPYRAADVEAGR